MLQMAWLCSLIIHHTVLFLVLDCFYFCNRFSYLEKSSGNSRGTSTYQHWGWAVNSFSLIHISVSPKFFQVIRIYVLLLKLTEINLKCNFQVGFNVSSSKLVEVWPFTWRCGITFRVAKCKMQSISSAEMGGFLGKPPFWRRRGWNIAAPHLHRRLISS